MNPISGLTFTESEERMWNQGRHIKLHDLPTISVTQDTAPSQSLDGISEGIRKEVEVAVTSAPSDEKHVSQGNFAFATGPTRKSTRSPR
jgi:hypothetical protein